ncbi:hypothetical protein AA15973_1108 [Komagataeibacter sucrofermentans DSM 15973]|nr:hypothetical protein AA15973_1108 [Komagataeibacter sucrofermentans DSM 15973]
MRPLPVRKSDEIRDNAGIGGRTALAPEAGMVTRIGNEHGITPQVPQAARAYDKVVAVPDAAIWFNADITRPAR